MSKLNTHSIYSPIAGVIRTVITRGLKTRYQYHPHAESVRKGPLRKSERSAASDARRAEQG